MTFLLLTVNDKLLPLTVVSRCQRLELAPMSVAAETAALIEKKGLEPQRASLLAGLSHGCPGWALDAAGNDSILEQRTEELDGIMKVIKGDYEERFTYVGRLAARFSQDRGAVYRTLDAWRDFWRDIMLQKLGRDDMIINIDRKTELAELAGEFPLGQIKGAIESIRACARQLQQNTNSRLALEVLMLDIPIKKGGQQAVSVSTSSPFRGI